MEVISIQRTIWINASRERVWQAITDPAEIQIWFSPGLTWQSTGFEVGARIFVHDPETDAELYTQIIESLEPPSRVVMRSKPEPPNTPETTTYVLTEENGGTRLTLTFSGYELMPEKIRNTRLKSDSLGFTMMLDNIKAHVEGLDLPYPQGF